MNKSTALSNIEQMPLDEFTEKAYLNYSMYVILDRALPHLADGLKPVQRRIIYGMSELGLKAGSKYKKSVRTIGDVLGKYHPHGDMACYEAMVLMAQDFSYRYPFIDGQGNWGSTDDPKSFAAMRYTEARLTPYAQVLLAELEQGTVNWKPNFDGSLTEPELLPARLPNILLNSTTGIAVGMATDIPPHNLNEVVDACVHLLDHPQASLDDMGEFIPGPDFPTGAEIVTPVDEIKALYQSGSGMVRLRSIYSVEEQEIIVNALPYQVSPSKVLEQIATQMTNKKLTNIVDLRDESDHENPTRLVITMRSNRVDAEALMSHLFATTDLERNYRVNMNVIGLDGRPKVKNLLEILTEWLEYRKDIVQRRLQFRLEQVLTRLHILDALLIVYLNIDEVIAIIRHEEQPKQKLIERFALTEQQADAILELKLRHLSKLEEIKIREEQQQLAAERDELEAILASKARLKALVRKELLVDKKQYSDSRRSQIVARAPAQAMREEEMIPQEAVTIVLSQQGWVRAGKGHDIQGEDFTYRAGDGFLMQAAGRSNMPVIFLDSTGKSYSLPAHILPSARGHGEPLTKYLQPESGANFSAVLINQPEFYYVLASDAGYGFMTQVQNLYSKSKAGKAIIKLSAGAKILPPQLITDKQNQYLAIVTNEGRLLLFPLVELPELPRGKGNKLIQIDSKKAANRQEYCVAIAVLDEKSSLILHSGQRHFTLKPQDLANFRGERGRRGQLLPRGFRRIDTITSTEKL